MKFRKDKKFRESMQIKIGDDWLVLAGCITCETLAAFQLKDNCRSLDNKIKCCSNPYYYNGGNPKVRIVMDEFIKIWRDD